MTLSSLDLGLPPWEIVGLLTGGLALSSFALSGTLQSKFISHLLCNAIDIGAKCPRYRPLIQ